MTELRTDRLVLRMLRGDDVDAFIAYRSAPDVLDMMTSAVPPTREQISARIEVMTAAGRPTAGEWFNLAIDHDGELVGDVVTQIRPGGGIAEIGYALRSDARGRGLAGEAAGALVDHLVAEHGVHRIEAGLRPDNRASMRVLESIGMRFEVVARDAFCRDGVWEDDLRYAMTADDRATWVGRPRGRPATVVLVDIDPDETSRWSRLRTHHSQEWFVSPMAQTWCDALFPELFEGVVAVPWMRGVVADGEPAGFLMASTNHGRSDGWYLWRMLIDRLHQRRGIGELAMAVFVEQLREMRVPRVYTSCVEGLAGTPRPFYDRLGFVPTGRIIDDETELVLELG